MSNALLTAATDILPVGRAVHRMECYMHQLLLLLAQNSRFEQGMAGVKFGLTLVGLGILVVGAGILFSKPNDPSKATSPAVKWLGLAIVTSFGCSLIAYAWLAF